MKLWKKNLMLLFFVVILVVSPLVILKNAEFSGADEQAEEVIKEINKDYEPWINPLFEPASGEIESLLFVLQAAIGAAILGFGFGRLSAKKNIGSENK
ncbi:UNVERIFIED_CONTAM: cobalt/nickel transport protein [Acetivibrio alkalicellulosi]